MDNEIDAFLKGLNEEGTSDPFTPETKDPFEAKPKEGEQKTEKTEETGNEGIEAKPIPFHKDPKVQRYIQREVERLTKDIKPSEVRQFIEDTGTEADEILNRIIGNDTPEKVQAVKDFKKYLHSIKSGAKQEALQEIEAQREAAEREEIETQNELVQGFESIEESYGVDLTSNTAQARKLRNDFIDFVRRVSPKDEYGEVVQFPDFEETFALFQEMGTKKTAPRAKELASRGVQRSGDAPTAPQITDNSWNAVDKMFNKLAK